MCCWAIERIRDTGTNLRIISIGMAFKGFRLGMVSQKSGRWRIRDARTPSQHLEAEQIRWSQRRVKVWTSGVGGKEIVCAEKQQMFHAEESKS